MLDEAKHVFVVVEDGAIALVVAVELRGELEVIEVLRLVDEELSVFLFINHQYHDNLLYVIH